MIPIDGHQYCQYEYYNQKASVSDHSQTGQQQLEEGSDREWENLAGTGNISGSRYCYRSGGAVCTSGDRPSQEMHRGIWYTQISP